MSAFISRVHAAALITLSLTASLNLNGQDFMEAEMMMKTGETTKALSVLKSLAKDNPKEGKLQILIGDCYVALDSSAKAIAAYKEAQKKGENEAWLSLARLALSEYRLEDAEGDIELYRKGLKKSRKQQVDNSLEIESLLTRTRNMLDRVEKVTVIDSVSVDKDDFLKYYRLGRDCGHLYLPQKIQKTFPVAEPSVVYVSPDGVEMIWAMDDTSMKTGLVSSSQLYGGEWETPVSLGEQLNEGGDANYPFMLNDGVTLYFANDGENSIGGYDIFISRRNSDGVFFQPQNLGMPYNSPYNDYMLAIDEQNNIGWWASDRNRIPGKVTIYTFIPSEMRVNYDVDDPNLAALARISSYKDTWADGKDYTSLLKNINRSADKDYTEETAPEFMLSVPGYGVYTSYKQFRSTEAAKLMKEYVKKVDQYNTLTTTLGDYRRKYAEGNRQITYEIKRMENERNSLIDELKKLKNQIIKTETL